MIPVVPCRFLALLQNNHTCGILTTKAGRLPQSLLQAAPATCAYRWLGVASRTCRTRRRDAYTAVSTPLLSPTMSKRRRGSSPRVLISNPEPNGKRHTTARYARELIMRGLAVLVAANVIRLVADIRAAVSDTWEDEQVDASMLRNWYAGVARWDGCDPGGGHLPGQGPAFHRPDWGAR